MNLEIQPQPRGTQIPPVDYRITEPGIQPPILEPTPEEYKAYFMPFPKSIRDWWVRVWGGQSGDVYYDETTGWTRSQEPGQEVHHIIPESELKSRGQNPDNTPAIPLSRGEHSGRGRNERGGIIPFGQKGHSMHPDMGEAREQYREGDKKAFEKAARRHKEKARRGQKIVNTDEQLDGWLTEQAKEKSWIYRLLHPEDPPPTVIHRNNDTEHWTDVYYGTRSYPEDEQ